jgi:hypothetical protein
VEVPTGTNGEAAIELYLLEGKSGVSTVKATVIRPAGVDRGTKRLELHSATLTNHWSSDAPLSMRTNAPPTMRWGERTDWSINVENRSSVAKTGTVSLPLPAHIHWLSSTPQPTSVTPQSDGGQLVTWHVKEFPAMFATQIRFVLQAVTDDQTLMSQPLNVDLNPSLSMFPPRDSGAGSSTNQDSGPPQTFAPPSTPGVSGPGTGGQLPGGGGLGDLNNPPVFGGPGSGIGTPPPPAQQGNSDPGTFANMLICEYQGDTLMAADRANRVSIKVTNNATTPFFQGGVQVQLPDGLVFCTDDGGRYVDDKSEHVTVQSFSFVDSSTGQEIAVQPNRTHTMTFHVIPIRTGNLKIRVAAFGQYPNSTQPYEIEGSVIIRTVNVPQP